MAQDNSCTFVVHQMLDGQTTKEDTMKRHFNINTDIKNALYRGSILPTFNMATLAMGALAISITMAMAVKQTNAAEKVGVQAGVHGTVHLKPATSDAVRSAKSGEGVYFLETVESGINSGLQILLLDETTFTVGPQSEIVIDEMVYDPDGNSKLIVSVAKGAFRYISGEIAKQNPENVSIRTPNGEIGIRGTSFFALSKPDTGGWYFGLLGPGPNNNTGDKAGGIVFKNEFGETEVRRSGYGFSVEPGTAPSIVAEIPSEIIATFEQQVSGATTSMSAGEGIPVSTETTEGGFSEIATVSGNTSATTYSAVKAEFISQELNAVLSGETTSAAAMSASVGGMTPLNYGQLKGYTGSATYAQNGVPMYYGQFPNTSGELTAADIKTGLSSLNGTTVGKYDFSMVANFNTRNIGATYSNLYVPTLGISQSGTAATLNASYLAKANVLTVEENSIQANIGGTSYSSNAMVSFIDGGGSLPNALQSLSISNASGQEVVIGASIIKP